MGPFDQRGAEHLADVLHRDDLQLFQHGLRNLFQVLQVLLGDEHGIDTRTIRGKQLFFEPADGQDAPRSVTSPVMATFGLTAMPVSAETSAVVIVTPALGPSLGTAPSGTWMWMSRFL